MVWRAVLRGWRRRPLHCHCWPPPPPPPPPHLVPLTERPIFFKFFLLYFYLLRSFQTQGPENIVRGLIISYSQFFYGPWNSFSTFKCHKFWHFFNKTCSSFIEFFLSCKILTLRILAFFWQFLPLFSILTFIFIIQVFWASRVRKPPLGFDNRLLANFCWSWITF